MEMHQQRMSQSLAPEQRKPMLNIRSSAYNVAKSISTKGYTKFYEKLYKLTYLFVIREIQCLSKDEYITLYDCLKSGGDIQHEWRAFWITRCTPMCDETCLDMFILHLNEGTRH